LEVLDRLARVEGPVLIQGESGPGKEPIARALHEHSPRKTAALEIVNCGAIPASLVESTFFGHVKGAFTGAERNHVGCFERAQGGSLFLDEIGDLPLEAQVKLLRVLQEKEITAVGGESSRVVDVRLIAATNRDLEKEVARGAFREDLFYRLNVLSLELPPLRNRQGDVSLLMDYFFKHNNLNESLGVTGISAESRRLLEAYPWPGNVRELENTMYRIMVLAQEREVKASDLPERIRQEHFGAQDPENWQPSSGELAPVVEKAVRDLEMKIIQERLKIFSGSKTKTAESLGIWRKTLFNKMKLYGLNP
jgi:transcriptional regulator with PAS, ATPase and Fis domain